MRCAACGTDNPDAARFCGGCGAGLIASCPECGSTVEPGLRFCTSCGARLGSATSPASTDRDAPASAAAERRRVSVVFVDLVDFTPIAEALDPEELRALQARYFDVARAVVATYGGTIEKFIGDAVMAVWGAPSAHEDDAVRAVRAALGIVDAVGRLSIVPSKQSLAARGAVTTGEAAVTPGAIGQGLVAGDLVNTAARLQSEAASGTVLVDEATSHLAHDAAEFTPAGMLALKGRSSPLATFAAALRVRPWPGRQHGSHAGRIVGRDRELRELLDLFDAVARDRRSRLVSVTGIAGIGKSRLGWELAERLETRPEVIAWHAGRAPAYGDEITFAAVAEMLRGRIRLADDADSELSRRQLDAALDELVRDDAERRWMAPRLAVLLGGDPSTTFDRNELFAAWRRFFERVSDAAPTVLVFEDLQWADPGLLDFVEHLATWARDHPILILVLSRPELFDRRPSFGAGLASFTSMRLHRLGDDAMRDLLVARAPALDEGVIGRILEHAGGVPLYAVEVARTLADRRDAEDGATERRSAPRSEEPGDGAAIPDSLHGLIAARIDALPSSERQLLRAAGVLGRRFRAEALVAVAGTNRGSVNTGIDSLVQRELLTIDDQPASPQHGELSFVQDLVREVAYGTLARTERRALHLAAARYLESRPEDELAEALAGHLLAAHRLAPDHPDAPRLARRAVGALRRAAQSALRLHAPERAVGHLEHALRLVDDPEQRAVVLSLAADATRAAARLDLAEGHLRELVALYRKADRRRETATARARLASVLLLAQQNEQAIIELEAALRSARAMHDDPAYVELTAQTARARMLVGDDRGGLEWAERGLAVAEPLGLHAVALDLLVTRGTARVQLGDEESGLDDLRRAIAGAEALDALNIELRARNNLAWLTVSDDPRAAMETAREAVELASTMGVGDMAVQLGSVACAVAIDTGDWAWSLQTAAELAQRPIPRAHQIDLASVAAVILSLQGEPTPLAALDALSVEATVTDSQLLASVDYARAWAAFVSGQFDAAHRLAAGAAERAFGVDRVHDLTLAGRAALWLGDRQMAGAALAELRTLNVRGRATDAAIQTLEAGVAALDGESGAGGHYRQVTEAWRGLELPVHLSLCQLDAHRLMPGSERPDEAIGALQELGGDGLLGLLSARDSR